MIGWLLGENLRSISLEICHQKSINEGDSEGTDGFEFKMGYKYNIPLHIQTLSSREISLRFCALVCVKTIVACLEGIRKRHRRSFHSKGLGGRLIYLSSRRKYFGENDCNTTNTYHNT